MLKNVPKIISPELLKILCEMGHGDEIVLADGNFPAESLGKRVIRADGHRVCELLEAIMELIPLDHNSKDNFILMKVSDGDSVKTPIWDKYKVLGSKDKNFALGFEERYAYYERAKNAYAIIATSESALYANIILKKGVI